MSQGDDFVNIFAFKGVSESDIINLDDSDEEIQETFSTVTNKRKGKKVTPIPVKKLKISKESESSQSSNNSSSQVSDKNSNNEIDIDNLDSYSFTNENSSSSSNQNKKSKNNNNKNNNRLTFNIDDDDDICVISKPTNTPSKLHLNTNINTNSKTTTTTTTTTTTNNNQNKPASIYTPSVHIAPLKENITVYLKLVGEPNQKMVFYTNSPLQKLIDLYCAAKNMDAELVQLKSFGLPLDPTKTPQQLELMDEDILDVFIKEVKAPNIAPILDSIASSSSSTTTPGGDNYSLSSSSSTLTNIQDDTPKIILQVRYNGQSYKFKIGTTEPFSKLLGALGKKIELPKDKKVLFKFDGSALKMESTPSSEDMEDEDLIDAIAK